jgi:hypothetical protein
MSHQGLDPCGIQWQVILDKNVGFGIDGTSKFGIKRLVIHLMVISLSLIPTDESGFGLVILFCEMTGETTMGLDEILENLWRNIALLSLVHESQNQRLNVAQFHRILVKVNHY